jgi:hypothetical protein
VQSANQDLEYVEVELAVPGRLTPKQQKTLRSSISNSPSMAVTGKVNLRGSHVNMEMFLPIVPHLTPENHKISQVSPTKRDNIQLWNLLLSKFSATPS